ncbi:hypothetical protein JCM11641_000846 [Rhodosporidiobolus odoratus]
MLFSRALPLLALVGTTLASISHPRAVAVEQRMEKRLAVEVTVVEALQAATKEVICLGGELREALEGVEGGGEEILHEVRPLIKDITHTVAGVIISLVKMHDKRSLSERNLDLNTVAGAVANLLNAVFAALKPLEDAIAATPGLGLLLGPLLLTLNATLITLLNLVFALVVGLLNKVLTLLDATLIPIFLRALGLGPLLGILTL